MAETEMERDELWDQEPMAEMFRDIFEKMDRAEKNNNIRHVFTVFGMAAFQAQALEFQARILLIGHARANEKISSFEEFQVLNDELSSCTLGRLMTKVRNTVPFDDNVKKLIEKGLQQRNFLSHDFYASTISHWHTTEGQFMMVKRLEKIAQACWKCDKLLEEITQQFIQKCGMSMEYVHEQTSQALQKAQAAKPPTID